MDINLGLIAIAAAIAVAFGCLSSIGEAWIISHAIDGMVRNPRRARRYAVLIIFILGARA